MPLYTDLMIDCEGLSLNPNAAVIQLAAVPFSREDYTIAPIHARFSLCIQPASYPREGYSVSGDTMQWWDNQDAALRKSVFSGLLSPEVVARNFASYLSDMQDHGMLPEKFADLRVWSRNILYDLPVVKNLMELEGQTYPFHYRSHRDVYQEMDGVHPEILKALSNNPVHHNAASDAYYQAKNVVEVMHWRKHGVIRQWPSMS